MKKYSLFVITAILSVSLFLAGCGAAKNNSAEQQKSKTSDSAAKAESPVIFTANEGGSLSKISVKEQKVLATLQFDGAVHNVQVSPDGKVVGAVVVPEMNTSGSDSPMDMPGKAVFIDPKTDQILKEVEVGNHPAHIVFTDNGKYVLVTNNEDNNVTVIDANNYSKLKTIPTGKGPHGFRISHDSKFAYVANMGEDSVSVLDLQSFKELKKIQVGETPVTTGITSDGKTLVVTVNKENTLAIMNLSNGEIHKVKVGEGPAQVYIQPDNQFAYVANQGTEENPSHSVTKVDLGTKTATATIETKDGSHGVTTSPDNKFTYVTNMFNDSVSVIDNSKNKVINTIKVDKIPNGISYLK